MTRCAHIRLLSGKFTVMWEQVQRHRHNVQAQESPQCWQIWLRKYLLIVIDSGTEEEVNRLLRGLPWSGGLASTLGKGRQKEVTLSNLKCHLTIQKVAGAKFTQVPATRNRGHPLKLQSVLVICRSHICKFTYSIRFICNPRSRLTALPWSFMNISWVAKNLSHRSSCSHLTSNKMSSACSNDHTGNVSFGWAT